MKILLLSQWFQPEPFFKGLPLAKALVARGHEVEVLTGFPNYPGGEIYPGYRVRRWQREEMEGIRVLRVPLYPSHDNSSLRRTANYLSFALSSMAGAMFGVGRPDVIWAYNLVTLAPSMRWLKYRYGCPAVLDVQDLWPESVTASGMLTARPWVYLTELISNWGYRSMDKVLAQAPGMRDNLIRRGLREDQVQVLYNWTEETAAPAADSDPDLAQRLGLADTFNVLFAGTMGQVQRLDVALEAAKKLMAIAPRARFIFVGGGVAVDGLKQTAQTLGLNNVVFLPRRPRAEMGRIMAMAHAGLVHLQDEPLFRITIPSKTQAYFHEGLPVLMAVAGDARALVESAQAGLGCSPGDPEALARTVVAMMSLPAAELKQMGERGREFYRREMSFDAGVSRLEACLRQACGVAG